MCKELRKLHFVWNKHREKLISFKKQQQEEEKSSYKIFFVPHTIRKKRKTFHIDPTKIEKKSKYGKILVQFHIDFRVCNSKFEECKNHSFSVKNDHEIIFLWKKKNWIGNGDHTNDGNKIDGKKREIFGNKIGFFMCRLNSVAVHICVCVSLCVYLCLCKLLLKSQFCYHSWNCAYGLDFSCFFFHSFTCNSFSIYCVDFFFQSFFSSCRIRLFCT